MFFYCLTLTDTCCIINIKYIRYKASVDPGKKCNTFLKRFAQLEKQPRTFSSASTIASLLFLESRNLEYMNKPVVRTQLVPIVLSLLDFLRHLSVLCAIHSATLRLTLRHFNERCNYALQHWSTCTLSWIVKSQRLSYVEQEGIVRPRAITDVPSVFSSFFPALFLVMPVQKWRLGGDG